MRKEEETPRSHPHPHPPPPATLPRLPHLGWVGCLRPVSPASVCLREEQWRLETVGRKEKKEEEWKFGKESDRMEEGTLVSENCLVTFPWEVVGRRKEGRTFGAFDSVGGKGRIASLALGWEWRMGGWDLLGLDRFWDSGQASLTPSYSRHLFLCLPAHASVLLSSPCLFLSSCASHRHVSCISSSLCTPVHTTLPLPARLLYSLHASLLSLCTHTFLHCTASVPPGERTYLQPQHTFSSSFYLPTPTTHIPSPLPWPHSLPSPPHHPLPPPPFPLPSPSQTNGSFGFGGIDLYLCLLKMGIGLLAGGGNIKLYTPLLYYSNLFLPPPPPCKTGMKRTRTDFLDPPFSTSLPACTAAATLATCVRLVMVATFA